MTAPAAPLEKAVAQGRAAMARWDKPEPVPVLRHSDAVDCVLALRSLLAALDADKRLEEAEAALREIADGAGFSYASQGAAIRMVDIARGYFARRGVPE